MMWPCNGVWFHKGRNIIYRYHAGMDLLGDWTIARFWGPADMSSGRRRITVHEDERSTYIALVAIVRRREDDGYMPLACAVTNLRARAAEQ